MPETIDIAVVGATGLVGEALVELLEERDFPVANLYLLASGESAGKSIAFRGRNIRVGKLDEFDFSRVRLAFLSVGAEAAADCSARAIGAGCSVIDLSGAALNHAAASLALTCVNGSALEQLQLPAVIAAPAAPAAEVAEVLAALRTVLEPRQVNVAACLSASALGREGVQELARQTAELLNARPLEPRLVDRQFAFNMLAQLGEVDEQGYSTVERRMAAELAGLFPELKGGLSVTCSLAPVFFGDVLMLSIKAAAPVSLAAVSAALEAAEGIELVEDDYPTVIGDAQGQDSVYVGRLRNGLTDSCELNLWIASDNVRKGAALNAVNLGELLIKHYL
ncbi:aspartate-semialdehyde dehydrogenase [Pseudomonas nitritireducens]|uniref:Aspartate-semialdehyde dehydrogenase n=1 Tax=Pseudomonas nitroreducens TaxID=46680 RepID=A0A7W7KJW1_PSENT|nr:aspartate-semialdehyde dehydrogenase [Pseudomonas nitritireducens]MBB4863649.1 aspartate-semialdehyde dehydrogenase [Pseudomonas nitritireducens]